MKGTDSKLSNPQVFMATLVFNLLLKGEARLSVKKEISGQNVEISLAIMFPRYVPCPVFVLDFVFPFCEIRFSGCAIIRIL